VWPTDANTEKIDFSESVYVPGSEANTLYHNAQKFASKAFNGIKDTVVQNDTTRTINCKSAFMIPVEELGDRGKGYVSFTLSVWCHNNYYRYSLTNLEHFPLTANGVIGGPLENEKAASGAVVFPTKYWNDQKAKCYYRIQTTIEQFKEAMKRPAEG